MPSEYYTGKFGERTAPPVEPSRLFTAGHQGQFFEQHSNDGLNGLAVESVAPAESLGLGRSAVLSALDGFNKKSITITRSSGNIALSAESNDEDIDIESIDRSLGLLEILTTSQQEHFNSLIAQRDSTELIRDILHVEGDDFVSALLVARTAVGANGERLVSDRAILNFFEWHNHALAKANAELQQHAQEYIDDFMKKFTELINMGILPESARDHLERLSHMHIDVDDGMHTDIHGIAGTHIGTNNNYHHVMLSPNAIDTSASAKFVRTHEFMHAMQGLAPNKDDLPEEWRRNDTSGLERVFGYEDDEDGGHILNEALTEHLALLIIYGDDANDLLPNTGNRNGSYSPERVLLDTLCHGGILPIDIRYFINAYFEDVANGPATNELFARLDQAFPGMSIISRIRTINRHSLEDSLEQENNNLEYYGAYQGADALEQFARELEDDCREYIKDISSPLTLQERLSLTKRLLDRTTAIDTLRWSGGYVEGESAYEEIVIDLVYDMIAKMSQYNVGQNIHIPTQQDDLIDGFCVLLEAYQESEIWSDGYDPEMIESASRCMIDLLSPNGQVRLLGAAMSADWDMYTFEDYMLSHVQELYDAGLPTEVDKATVQTFAEKFILNNDEMTRSIHAGVIRLCEIFGVTLSQESQACLDGTRIVDDYDM